MTIQTLYGIMDENRTLVEAELQSRDIAGTQTLNGRIYRAFEQPAPLPAGKKGWFLDWDNPTAGERMVVRPQMRGTAVVTSTMIPPTALSCDAGGTGFINSIEAFTGTALATAFFDKNGDGVFDNNDNITVTTPDGNVGIGTGGMSTGGGAPTEGVFVDNRFFYGMTDGGRGSAQVPPKFGTPRRVMWREILQD
jgi:type IV pilus assembly protein PilY1